MANEFSDEPKAMSWLKYLGKSKMLEDGINMAEQQLHDAQLNLDDKAGYFSEWSRDLRALNQKAYKEGLTETSISTWINNVRKVFNDNNARAEVKVNKFEQSDFDFIKAYHAEEYTVALSVTMSFDRDGSKMTYTLPIYMDFRLEDGSSVADHIGGEGVVEFNGKISDIIVKIDFNDNKLIGGFKQASLDAILQYQNNKNITVGQ